MQKILKYWQWFESALFPPRCLVCRREGPWLCPKHHDFEPAPQNVVNFSYLDDIFAATRYYQKNTEALILQFKFKGLKNLATLMAPIIVEKIPPNFIKENTILVPIPLHPTRHFWRGFNQSKILAQAISQALQIKTQKKFPIISLLKRQKRTQQQAKLPKEKRLKNIQEAFLYNPKESFPTKLSLSNKNSTALPNIILIDDVVASGQTLEEAAKTLKKQGFPSVQALVFARGGK